MVQQEEMCSKQLASQQILLDGDDVFIVREVVSEDVTNSVVDLVSSSS